jgi:hypothetical protein
MKVTSRLRPLRHAWTREGRRALARRALSRVLEYLGPEDDIRSSDLLPSDVANSGSLRLPVPARRPAPGQPLNIAWVSTPPGPGSGGHTTMFRMIEALEQAGHNCTLALYNPTDSDLADRERIIRDCWPRVRAKVRPLVAGLDGHDVAVATAWQTAHALAKYGTNPMRRLYFIQDYEPYFYPRGTRYALAEDTYHFGFRAIALGKMVADRLARESHVASDFVPFGCDTATYHLVESGPRTGVVFYAMPGNPRRGYALNRMALEQFNRAHPAVPIHAYGNGRPSDFAFPVTWHGRLRPDQLNALYCRSVAGLSMSFTNISLVAEEMLASGCIPVVNDAEDARADLDNPYVAWTPPTPIAIAERLAELLAAPDLDQRARQAAASARPDWSAAQAGVVQVIENETYGG